MRRPPPAGRPASAWPEMRVLGTRIHCVRTEEVLAAFERWIAEGRERCRFVVNTGFHGLEVARRDPAFRAILNGCDLFSPDGIAPVLIARLRRLPLRERATSADLMARFFERADARGYASFFLGDTEETLSALRASLERRWPGHRVVGTLSPPFRALEEEEEEAIVARINEARPDVLWVGLGLPKQERWIHRHLPRLRVPVAVGVGACFGFFSGRVRRVPGWLGRLGFEWLWRVVQEPRKLWRRVLLDGPRFLWHAGLEVAGLKRYGPGSEYKQEQEEGSA